MCLLFRKLKFTLVAYSQKVSKPLHIVLLLCAFYTTVPSLFEEGLQLADRHSSQIGGSIKLHHLSTLLRIFKLLQELGYLLWLEGLLEGDGLGGIPIAESQERWVPAARRTQPS